METIHKKNDRLHIYVRQDKYKGELKSHNWVGRTYINGKQKIISSGTTDLEKATVILEKWFDDLQLEKTESKDTPIIEKKIHEFISAAIEWLPMNKIVLDKDKIKSVLSFLEMLEDDDDVQHVYANLEIDNNFSDKSLKV